MTSGSLPFVSVVIPTFERPALLARCLESLLRVDLPRDRFEVIVVDDGGSQPLDAALAVARAGLDLTLLRQPNGGPASARNRGAERARGDLLAFLDDDCRAARGWLSQLAAAHAAQPERLLGGRVWNELPQNPYATASQLLLDLVYEKCNRTPDAATFLTTNNMAVPRRSFDEIGGFESRLRTAEDREFCDRWRFAGRKITFVTGAVVSHAHDLDLRGFWRQHRDYGRGASAFHRLCRERGSGDMRHSIHFHSDPRNWLWPAFGRTHPARTAGLLILLQIANAVGFCQEELGREILPRTTLALRRVVR